MRLSLNRRQTGVVQIFLTLPFLAPFFAPSLTPASATVIFVLGCLAGYRYRAVWKAEGPRWQLWLTGLVAAAAFLTLGFVPMAV